MFLKNLISIMLSLQHLLFLFCKRLIFCASFYYLQFWMFCSLSVIEKVLKDEFLLAVQAEAAKIPIGVFLYQHQTSQTTLLNLPTAQKSFFSD